MANGLPYYQVSREGSELLGWAALGLQIKHQPSYNRLELIETIKRSYDDLWEPLWGKSAVIRNEYHELQVTFRESGGLSRALSVIFRVYNDGVAWRYILPKQSESDSITVKSDLSAFNLPPHGTWWAFHGERKNLGPADMIKMPDTVQTPFLYKNSHGQFIAILEAEIKNMAYFTLQRSPDKPYMLSCVMPESTVKLPCKTSWRVVMTGDNERQLVESNLLVNLNPSASIKDISWIKPGKSTWNWRGRGYETATGFTYRIDTESQKRFIDFASDNNIQYHLIDANWYGPEFSRSSDPTVAKTGFDIQQILSYAKKRHVGIFLYLNDVGAKKYGLERILKQFHDWGAAGVKYGFMKGHGQKKVLYTRKVISLCAKYQLMLIFHDNPVPPSGDHRTWPHVLAREYGHAQADGKYAVYPEEGVNQAFINMLTGSLDLNYGWFDLNEAAGRIKVQEAVPGTVAGELARMAASFSGFVCLPDVPEEYLKNEAMLDFIRRLPTTYDAYEVLSGKIDQYLSVARRTGNNWIVGSLTNRQARKITIKLDFLQKGEQYLAYFYEDAAGAHFLNNKEACKTRKKKVRAGDIIQADMAPGGGHCIYIEMID